jgi:UrcA family protein
VALATARSKGYHAITFKRVGRACQALEIFGQAQEMTMNTITPSSNLGGLIAAAIFGALASSVSAVSAADAGTEPVSLTVKFADLDISKPPGAAVLYARVSAAAESACSFYWFKSDADQYRCVHGAIANAVTKVNQPELFAVYNAKNKAPLPTALVSQSR